jgi:hypothetical protein
MDYSQYLEKHHAYSTVSAEGFATDHTAFEITVKAYLKLLTRADIQMINRWTSHADVPIAKLLAFQTKIRNVEGQDQLQVYRGIGNGLSYQEKMDLYEKKFIFHCLKQGVGPGHQFSYSTPRPLSFSDDLNTAKAFGNTIVTTVFDQSIPYIRITQAFWEAANRIEAASLFQEVILLKINEPVQYQVFQI